MDYLYFYCFCGFLVGVIMLRMKQKDYIKAPEVQKTSGTIIFLIGVVFWPLVALVCTARAINHKRITN